MFLIVQSNITMTIDMVCHFYWKCICRRFWVNKIHTIWVIESIHFPFAFQSTTIFNNAIHLTLQLAFVNCSKLPPTHWKSVFETKKKHRISTVRGPTIFVFLWIWHNKNEMATASISTKKKNMIRLSPTKWTHRHNQRSAHLFCSVDSRCVAVINLINILFLYSLQFGLIIRLQMNI